MWSGLLCSGLMWSGMVLWSLGLWLTVYSQRMNHWQPKQFTSVDFSSVLFGSGFDIPVYGQCNYTDTRHDWEPSCNLWPTDAHLVRSSHIISYPIHTCKHTDRQTDRQTDVADQKMQKSSSGITVMECIRVLAAQHEHVLYCIMTDYWRQLVCQSYRRECHMKNGNIELNG